MTDPAHDPHTAHSAASDGVPEPQPELMPSPMPPSKDSRAATPAPGEHVSRHGALAKAVRATGGMTLLSRLGGLARDVIVGRIFGDTAVGSAFAAGFAVPNMFRRLFGEGALSAAFIPAYAEAQHHGKSEADQLASMTVFTLALVTSAITVIIEVVLFAILVLAPQPDRDLSLKLIMVMLPFMPMICIVAIQAGMLQLHGKFGPAASGPLILNTLIVAVGASCLWTGRLAGENIAYLLGIATVLSGVTQCFWFFRLLKPHVDWTRSWRAAKPRGQAMLKRFVPVAIGLGTLQLNAFVDMLIAMWPIWVGATLLGHVYPLDTSSNIILSLTQRLYQFPLGVFGIAIATAAFPLLARYAKHNEHFVDTLRRGVRLSLFVGIPASAGLVLIRHDVTGVMFGHGQTGWSASSIERSALVLTGFSAGIWAYSLNHVFTRVFYAKSDTRTPMRIALWMVLLNFSLNVSLIWVPGIREAGLAWGTSIAAIVQCLVLMALAKRLLAREGWTGPMLDGAVWRTAAKIVVATAVMGACVLVALRFAPLGQSWKTQSIRLAIGVGAGGASYLGAILMLRMPEWKWLIGRA